MYPMSFQQYTRQQDHKEDKQFENYPTAATYLEDHYLDEYLLRPFTWKTTYYLEVACRDVMDDYASVDVRGHQKMIGSFLEWSDALMSQTYLAKIVEAKCVQVGVKLGPSWGQVGP